EKMVKSIASKVGGYLDEDKFVVVLGGEHSVSIGPVIAHHRRRPGFGVLQLDAHADLRQEYLGSKYNHACVMARVAQMCPAVQVGIRSMSSEELENANTANIFFAEKIHDSDEWIQDVLSRLPERVYITIDLDVFDPAVMPSTGTPEPGGMNWYDVLKLLRTVADNRNIIGFDVVELCPGQHNRAPDFLAAKLIYKLLSYKFRG
ncbi:MAG: agmatinase, partial [Planctomycetota bacterium]|nr:agmatinase [Planctomycetota bacterium]